MNLQPSTFNPQPIDPATYQAALDLVKEIDHHLTRGTQHYRDRQGNLLTHLDQVVEAALKNNLLQEDSMTVPAFSYQPLDGDFEIEHIDELSRLAYDLLGDQFAEAAEIALSLRGPEMNTHPPKIRVEATYVLEAEGWEYDRLQNIPEGWTYEQVAIILSDGYTVYFQPT